MKKRVFFSFLFICSLTLNAVLIGIWFLHSVPYLHGCTTSSIKSAECKKCPMRTKLGLSDAQWARLEPRLAAFHRQSYITNREIADSRSKLIDELEKPRPDSLAISKCLERIQTGQSTIQKMIVDRILDEKDILTIEQRGRFFKMMRHTVAGANTPGMTGALPLGCENPAGASGVHKHHEE